MEKTLAFLYFIMFIVSYGLFFYLLTKTNFEKIFKPGKIGEIRVGYFIISFILASLFAFGIEKIVENVYLIILQ